jgi:glc operon protein GlcG
MNRITASLALVALGLASVAGGIALARPMASAAPRAASACAIAGVAFCNADPDDPSVTTKHTLTLHGANQALAAAIAEARSRNAGGAIAVVDDGGNLLAFQRLDGTFAAGAEVSIGKARSAAQFRKPTAAFENSIKEGRNALLGVSVLTPLQGGVPIEHEGQIVGAIGVSGAHSAAEDEQIAIAGAKVIASTPTISGH